MTLTTTPPETTPASATIPAATTTTFREAMRAAIREAMLRDFETNVKQNGYLLGQISGKYEYGEEPETLLLVPEFYKKITAAGMQAAAKTYLDTNNYVQVTLFPAK